MSVTLKPFLIRQSEMQMPCIPAPITPIEDFDSPPSFIIFLIIDYMRLKQYGADLYSLFVLPGRNYHVYDIPLFWRNLQDDVVTRVREWTAANS